MASHCKIVFKTDCTWKPHSGRFCISDHEIHVWRIGLNMPEYQIRQMEKCLSEKEKLKATGFRYKRDSQSYIVSHGAMRIILGSYLDLEPVKIEFNYTPLGKPSIFHEQNTKAICFNLSHSGELALCAATFNRPVGIDVEYIHRKSNTDSLAKRIFSPDEYTGICRLSNKERKSAFFDLWTIKEAYLKATGIGISSIEQVEKKIFSGHWPILVDHRDKPGDWEIQSVTRFIPEDGYTAAVATTETDHALFFYDFA